MTNQQIFTIGMIVSTLVQALGMVAENKQREIEGCSLAYTEGHFTKLLTDNGVTHNNLITALYHQ